jgi:hypothetical protein
MDKVRIGIPTSSQMWKLFTVGTDKISFGKPALTYLKEKKREKLLGIEMSIGASNHATSWGSAIEGYLYDTHIEAEYSLESNKTTVHESGLFAGTKDLLKPNCVGEIKCPHTRTAFCDLVEIIDMADIDNFRKECPEYYFQCVTNSVLEKTDYAELIVFMPYESEIPAIVEYIDLIDDFQLQKDIQWVLHEDIKRIPHIPDGCEYKNVNRFKFLVPKEDKAAVIEKTKLASYLL